MRFVLFGTAPLGALAGGALAGAIGTREALWVLTTGSVLPVPVPVLVLVASPLRTMRDLPAGHTGERALSPAPR
jgi:hypothetical protein